MGTKTFGAGAVGLAVAVLAVSVGLLRHEIPPLAGVGVGLGVVLGLVGGLTLAGRGFEADSENLLIGVATVFGSVAGFGLVVTAVMVVIG